MKRLLSLLIAVAILMSVCTSTFALEDSTFSVDDGGRNGMLQAGDKLTLSVTVPPVKAICTLTVRLAFDNTRLTITALDIPSISSSKKVFPDDLDEALKAYNDSGYITAILGLGEIENYDMTEAFSFGATFKVKENAAAGTNLNLIGIDEELYGFENSDGEEINGTPAFAETQYAATINSAVHSDDEDDGSTDPAVPETPDQEPETVEKKMFTDVEGHWAERYIYRAAEENLFKGYPDGSFRPDANVTRAQFVTVLYRYCGSPQVNAETPFTDISGLSEEFRSAITWAYSEGLVNGVSKDRFAPGSDITRQEVAKILFKLSGGIPGGEVLFYSVYDDAYEDSADISEWARSPMYWAIYNELLKGISGNKLGPKHNATRGQIAKILINYLDRSVVKQ